MLLIVISIVATIDIAISLSMLTHGNVLMFEVLLFQIYWCHVISVACGIYPLVVLYKHTL